MMPYVTFSDRTRRYPPYPIIMIVTCDRSHGFLPYSETFRSVEGDPRDIAIAAGWRFLDSGETLCRICAI
jgi:hypothetical protein